MQFTVTFAASFIQQTIINYFFTTMKKSFILFCLLMATNIIKVSANTSPSGYDSGNSVEMSDTTLVPIIIGYEDPWGDGKKSPIQIPLVYQDGNTLTFGSYISACTLQLRDADGDVVYETTISAGATSAILPDAAQLGGTGTYELRLVFDDYYFYADITL